MESTSAGVYVATFLARCDAARRPGQARVDERGVHGLGPSGDDRRIRLLVTEDRGYDVLCGLRENARAGMVDVFSTAAQCARLIDGDPAWRAETVTAMICRELQTVPAVSLPGELALRPVRRLTRDAPDGVSLEDAVAAASVADPRITDRMAVATFLRSLPPAMQFFAAVDGDGDGVVRATAGAGAFGRHASVIFINTVPAWRGRGVGRAMTAAALRAAAQSGAHHAGLDATEAGLGIYKRLGFEVVAVIRRFSRSV